MRENGAVGLYDKRWIELYYEEIILSLGGRYSGGLTPSRLGGLVEFHFTGMTGTGCGAGIGKLGLNKQIRGTLGR